MKEKARDKLTVLNMISICTGVDWLCQFECKISAAADNLKKCEKGLRNIMLEILLDQDDAMMDAFCYCLKITKTIDM